MEKVLARIGFGVRAIMSLLGLEPIKSSDLRRLRFEAEISGRLLALAAEYPRDFADSRSQLGQDLFVLACLGASKPGFFVEFGATDGVSLSNTFLLEESFGWRGIVCEPARVWRKDLLKNRRCYRDLRAVWAQSGLILEFNETDIAELSTLKSFSSSDLHSSAREAGKIYPVETVSLFDLLVEGKAPSLIDYISIDTEGSELEVLRSFDFSAFRFRVISVEHNGSENKAKIDALLTSHGYLSVFSSVSRWDSWYVDINLI